MTEQRRRLLQALADRIAGPPADRIVRVGIDGVDGAGKTYFADELAAILQGSGRSAIRASVDGFHNPRVVRYQRGRSSPEGFYYDSYDYGQLKAALLDPLSPGGDCRYRTAAFDHRLDTPVDMPERTAAAGDILIVDGIFLHRPELRAYWDCSVFLDVPFAVSMSRGAERDGGPADPSAPENQRYVRGQELYLRLVDPARSATIVVNNDDLDSPYVVDRPMLLPQTIRRLEPRDAEAWAFLRREALDSHPLVFGSSPPDNQQELVDAALARLAPGDESAIFGEFADTALVGIVGVSRLPGKKERHKAFIWGMYVTASRRRQGVAERLLREAIGQARSWAGVEQIHLSVSEFAPDARRLYDRLGFREWGREPRALSWEGRSADEAHMVLDLRATRLEEA